MTHTSRRAALAMTLLAPAVASQANASTEAADREAILAVVNAYFQHEGQGDMLAQADLMTDDRSMLYVGGRLTGPNRPRMVESHAAERRRAQEFPGVGYTFELRDIAVQAYNGDSALVMLETAPTRVIPRDLPPQKLAMLGASKKPYLVALMLVKQAGAWKIAFTGFVPTKAA